MTNTETGARLGLAIMVLVLVTATATGADTFYIAPNGDDANDGLSDTTPWQNWAHAFRRLRPGDTLIVGEGTWTNADAVEPGDPEPHFVNARLPYVNCVQSDKELQSDLGLPYASGTPEAPITVRAASERNTLLRSKGNAAALQLVFAKGWTFDGLRGESDDLPGGEPFYGYKRSVFSVESSSDIRFIRLLGARDNRYFNNHIFEFIRSFDCRVEECEAYKFHRHGFSAISCDRITFERCYAHSRWWADIDGGYASHDNAQDEGDEGIVCYFSNQCRVINCIVEECEGIQVTGDDNIVAGCITIGGDFGFRFAANCSDSGAQICFKHDGGPGDQDPGDDRYPTDNMGINLLAIDAEIAAFDCDTSGGTWLSNITSVNAHLWGFVGRDRVMTEGFDTTFTLERAILVRDPAAFPPVPGCPDCPHAPQEGCPPCSLAFLADGGVTDTWSARYINAWGHDQDFSPPSLENAYGAIDNVFVMDPGLGANLVHVPETSPLHDIRGAPVGAMILYRYDDDIVLTNVPLWNPFTAEFPQGAWADGVNGPFDGDGAWNVHMRLNVNTNGGALPDDYGE